MAYELEAPSREPTFLAFTAAELEIASAAADVFAGLTPIERLHGPGGRDLSRTQLNELADLGWFGLMLSDSQGGSELSAVEAALFFREAGRVLAPLELVSQTLAALVAGDPDLVQAFAKGQALAAIAVKDGDELRVFGSPEAEYAVIDNGDGVTLIALSGLTLEDRPCLDPGTSMRVAPLLTITPLTQSGDHYNLARIVSAALLVGLAEGALDLIVEYAKVRETFGRKIGSYQAVRHPAADMALRVESARSQLWYAAASVKDSRSDARAHAIAAKHLANQAAVLNADVNIQLHGGIGVTDEHHAHLFLKRALLLSQLFGSKRALLRTLLHSDLED